ncbi:MAG TPA: nickel-responsive transcriptional regulator NikR [bacterium]|nr:nickel-responsive transcriptional regulator NikR [Candidatus Omnitrophota bacterium]HOJ61344.1 nickel-responsive transcriptional regulator NikR [bacterium]HOL95169.1 nickel-responsive transcriptional regulator NikR [bacterium]HPO99644.1 nickel-responsive transcriptional regulator NikR [bacterium]
MSGAIRFSVSLSEELLEKFDKILRTKGYTNRSEGIRDLIRDFLVQQEVEENKEVLGVISLVYDHHVRELTEKLIAQQHHSQAEVISSLHVHLDHHNCLEVIVARGRGDVLRQFADLLIGIRGVKHGKYVLTSTGTELPR